mmetsp:Transcript_36877/g.78246  ORF Transcript_36877/g.78246 Transcript_36877/m.78246 type:complete len:189 (+) Transcript_36877:96-662(+)|eukprot:CAMPEP_0206457464 /NCGR_PEP_ID=MMETSP0324_2-20121206/22973_1 /ASSEMBLY_ACC=CAM_ASM_000836 /TAXON_ID=2866 /ORGANISM="Crypthecodinium cohnii, Strain Seligo" /LENGTH=188 /DNA_ID=CAMNT_0053928583 /DNA_START=53 /DNA_END=619 /DNA_ORIENTATION=+
MALANGFAKAARTLGATSLVAAGSLVWAPSSRTDFKGIKRPASVESIRAESRSTAYGRFCLEGGAPEAGFLDADKADKIPMGEVVSVVECRPGDILKYDLGCPDVAPEKAQAQVGPKKRLCFDYAVVLDGRVDQYRAGSEGAGTFPTTLGPGRFLTERAVLHNSWQVPCQLALVRLPAAQTERSEAQK